MTAIEGIGWRAAPRIASRTAAKPGSFVVPSQPDGAEPSAAAAAPQSAASGSMLVLQELGIGTVADREARRHGQDMLAALATLQRALLTGRGDEPALRRLADLAATVPVAADARLAAAVSAILVRVRVELARRQGHRVSDQ